MVLWPSCLEWRSPQVARGLSANGHCTVKLLPWGHLNAATRGSKWWLQRVTFLFELHSNILFSLFRFFLKRAWLELTRFGSSGKQFVLWNSEPGFEFYRFWKPWFSEVLTYTFNLFSWIFGFWRSELTFSKGPHFNYLSWSSRTILSKLTVTFVNLWLR